MLARWILICCCGLRMFIARAEDVIRVRWTGSHDCILSFQGIQYKCALGKNGVAPLGEKIEGDGRTPAGTYALRRGFFRSDRIDPPAGSGLVLQPLHPTDGWCDDPASSQYNKLVTLPIEYSAEQLWRGDDLYDLFAVIEYNTSPIASTKGSAIFFHVASDGYGATAGCVSLNLKDLLTVFSNIRTDTVMVIE